MLDFGQGVAGPYCGQLLGDQGADVIKIEPPRGDWSRSMGIQDETGLSGTFLSANRNKRSLCLDLRQPEGIALARQIAGSVDVIIESFRPGVMQRLGLDSAVLREANPRLVFCSVTGFGPAGPNVHLPAGDSIMQGYGGLMSIVGERDGQPLRVGNVVSDMLAGMNAFSGVLLALMQRQLSGRGKDVHVSLLDSIVAFQGPPLSEFLLTGKEPRRLGNVHPLIAPSGAVEASDGQIMLTVLDHQWVGFCERIEMPHFSVDPRFATSSARQQNRDELSDELAPIFRTRGKREWILALRALDVLCSPINLYPDLLADPQVIFNGLIGVASDASGRSLPNLRNPIRLEGEELCHRSAPKLGEHTREILQGVCGCDTAKVSDLLARGVALESEPGVHESS